MYVCLDCGETFSFPEIIIEKHGLDSPPYEESIGCPTCGGAFVETMSCDICGEYITNEYVETIDGSIYCEDCYSVKNVEYLI